MIAAADREHGERWQNISSVKVLMICTGIGRVNRGLETFLAEAFDGLNKLPGMDLTLVTGVGTTRPGQETAFSLHRDHAPARIVGKLIRRNGYIVEQLSSLPFVVAKIRRIRPDVVFSSEANLAMQLMKYRRYIGVPYRYIYSNGAPMAGPFPWADYVHQVTPAYRDIAADMGEDPARQFLVPYGFTLPDKPPNRSLDRRRDARAALGLPRDGRHILSVGWVARQHKRMDYVIDEVARIPGPKPFLTIIGAMDEGSASIREEAVRKLGVGGFAMRSVAPGEMKDYYQAADVFALGSLNEGFGRVYVEALGSGLPVFSHSYPVARFVNGPEAFYGDFSESGGLAGLLTEHLSSFEEDEVGDRRRWVYAATRFSWSALADDYRTMFRSAAQGTRRNEPNLKL